MEQDQVPSKPGDICWRPEYVAQMLSPVSQVGSEAAEWFLATHSPVVCQDAVGPVLQQDLFASLFGASKPETLVIVKGHPGTGKSQLINWLKLRFDDALQRGEQAGVGTRKLRSVLIRRRSGSLKDALEQLVEQLPEYERYLAKIRAAIADVSGDTAKRRLYSEMHHSLYAGRRDAPKMLRHLDEVFNANATVKHLCRDGGAIDRNIRRLTEHSDASAREALPPFTAEDFSFPPNARSGYDEDLGLRLEDDESVKEQAAARATAHLREAIAGLTGLRGHTLNEIFRQIREQMQRQDEALALFVEDVSTLSVLDEELVNALQPLNDATLCPLISVLGMTLPAFDRLPDNLKQRADHVLDLSQQSSLDAGEGPEAAGDATDRFVARYLNALRAGAGQLRVLGEDVRQHDEQRHSVCDSCSLRAACFNAFGSTHLGDIEVGLYPLARGASRRLLEGLDDTRLLTPRTLLQSIVLPLLSSMGRAFRGSTVGLSVQPRSPRDLAAEQDHMLSGWSAEQKGRTAYLVYYWTGSETLADGQSALSAMLPWFGHPAFSATASGASAAAPKKPADIAGGEPGRRLAPPPPPPPEALSNRKYDDAIARLTAWFQQDKPLARDSEFRDLLAAVIRNSLPLDDVRVPSDRIRRKVTPIRSSNIDIEGMITKAAVRGKGLFRFKKSQEVYDLLRDLCAFEYWGGKTWRFAGGADARRRFGTWLARNTDRLVAEFNTVQCDREAALRAGIRFLRLAYRFSLRKDLPSDTGSTLEAIASFQGDTVQTLAPAAQLLAAGLPQRVQEVRALIFEEQAVTQGATGGVNYIDPRAVIEHLSTSADDLSLGDLDVGATVVDYPEITRLFSTGWARLEQVLQEEHDALRKLTDSLYSTFRFWGLSTGSLPQALREHLEGGRAVLKAYEGTGHSLGDTSLPKQIRDLTPSVVARHVAALQSAVDVVESGSVALLGLDVAGIKGTVDLVKNIDDAMRRLQQALESQLSNVLTADEVQADRQQAMAAVEELVALSEEDPAGEGGS